MAQGSYAERYDNVRRAETRAECLDYDESAMNYASVILVWLVLPSGLCAEGMLTPDVALEIIRSASFDSVHYVAIKSEENTFLGDAMHISRVSYRDDVWLLEQRDVRETEWDRSGILVRDGIAYFAALDPPRLFGGDCVVCHANGPRSLQGEIVSGKPEVAVYLNKLVGQDGVIRAYIPEDDPIRESDRLELAVCTECHNDKQRSSLYGTQVRSMYFQTEHEYMPPREKMTKDEKHELYGWMKQQVRSLW